MPIWKPLVATGRQMRVMKLILIFCPFILLSQNESIEKLIKLQSDYLFEKNYDSLLVVCKEINDLDKSAAKENNIDYLIALSYFKLKKYDDAINASKNVIPKIYVKGNSRESAQRNMNYQTLCFELYQYYDENGDYKLAYKNLSLINRKFNRLFCGNGRKSWQSDLYSKMIECSNKSGNLKRAKRIERKQIDLNK